MQRHTDFKMPNRQSTETDNDNIEDDIDEDIDDFIFKDEVIKYHSEK